MNARPDPDVVIAAWLQDEAPEGAPERLLTASRDRIRSTHQRRAWWSARGTRPMTRTTLAAAVVVAMVALGGAFFVIQRACPRSSAQTRRPGEPPARASPPTRSERDADPDADRARSPSPLTPEPRADVVEGHPRRALAADRLAWRSLRAGRRGLRRGPYIHRRLDLAVLQPAIPTRATPSCSGDVRDLAGRGRRLVEPGGWAGLHEQAPDHRARHRADRPSTRCAHGRRRPSRAGSGRSASGLPGSWPSVHSAPRLGRLGRLQAG